MGGLFAPTPPPPILNRVKIMLNKILWIFTDFYSKLEPPQVKHNLKSSITCSLLYKVPHQFANTLKTQYLRKLEKIKKFLKFGLGYSLMINLNSIIFIAIAVKDYAKTDIKHFWSFPHVLYFVTITLFSIFLTIIIVQNLLGNILTGL